MGLNSANTPQQQSSSRRSNWPTKRVWKLDTRALRVKNVDKQQRGGENPTKGGTRNPTKGLLTEFMPLFTTSNAELGMDNVSEHRIETGDAKPIFQYPFFSSWKTRAIIQKQVNEMEARGIIEKSHSPWASPVVLLKKPDDTWRFCIDYRKLNAVTTYDVYLLPLIVSTHSSTSFNYFHVTWFGIRVFGKSRYAKNTAWNRHLLNLVAYGSSRSCHLACHQQAPASNVWFTSF